MTRSEHLEWCKQRALVYIDNGDVKQAWMSMMSDLKKHPETTNHLAIETGFLLYMAGGLSSTAEMRKFILGFN